MIQRIQSIYLFMAVLFNIGMAFLPVFSISEPDLNLRVYAFTQTFTDVTGESVIKPAPWSILFSISLAIIATIVVIFLYNNRKRQIQLCYLLYLLQVLIILLSLVWITTKLQIPLTYIILKGHPLSLIFPVICMLWIFMAQRAIKKDEVLVRSVDRIR